MEDLIAYLRELRADNAGTAERLRAEQQRDEKEKADIAAAERTLTSWWEKHRPGEPLPEDVTGEKAKPIHVHLINPDPVEGLKQAMLVAFDLQPTRFTTKEFFPMIGAIQSGEVPESQGYDFLRKQVEDGKLWIGLPGAGRRATTYTKDPADAYTPVPSSSYTVPVPNGVRTISEYISKAIEGPKNPAAIPTMPGGANS